MWLLRLLTVLTLFGVAGGVGAYLLTGNARYLRFSWKLFRFALAIAFAVFGLLILERLAA